DPPQGLRADKASLVNGAEIWETVPQPLQTFAADRRNHLSLSVRDGPTWDAGAKVDVVLQLSTSSGTYFIQRRGVQVIGAVERIDQSRPNTASVTRRASFGTAVTAYTAGPMSARPPSITRRRPKRSDRKPPSGAPITPTSCGTPKNTAASAGERPRASTR